MDTSQQSKPNVALAAKRSWRRHSAEFKARVIELARQPHASVAAVALANGLNANMLRRWVREAEAPAGTQVTQISSNGLAMPAFVPLPMPQVLPALPTPPSPAPADTRPDPTPTAFVKLHRGEISAYVNLPLSAKSAAWLREVLG